MSDDGVGCGNAFGLWHVAVDRLDGNVIYCKSVFFWKRIYFMKAKITAMVYDKGYREQRKVKYGRCVARLYCECLLKGVIIL